MKTRFARPAPVLALAILATGCATPEVADSLVAPDAPRLVVLSYNVNYGLAGDSESLSAIRESGADLVLLQETNEDWERALASLAPFYPHQRFVHRPGAGGLGVLSRLPFEDGGILEPPEGGWFPAWIVVAESPVGRIQAMSVHLRPAFGDDGGVVSGYFTTPCVREDEMQSHLDRLRPDLPTIVAGDFNEGSGGAALAVAASRGFTRVDLGEDTWRWRTSAGTLSLELDHFLHDDTLVVDGAEVLRRGRSDHLAVLVRFARSDR